MCGLLLHSPPRLQTAIRVVLPCFCAFLISEILRQDTFVIRVPETIGEFASGVAVDYVLLAATAFMQM